MKAKVTGLVAVSVLSAFLGAGALLSTDRGWGGAVPGVGRMHLLTESEATHVYEFATEIDGLAGGFVLDVPVQMGLPVRFAARAFDVDDGDTTFSGWFGFRVGDTTFGSSRPMLEFGGWPKYEWELSSTVGFEDPLRVVSGPFGANTQVVLEQDLWLRVSKVDREVQQLRRPSPVIFFQATQPPPPPPPPGVLVDVRWLSGWDLQWTYGAKTVPVGPEMWQDGVEFEVGSVSSPDSLVWKSFMGDVRVVGAEMMFVANGDTFRW